MPLPEQLQPIINPPRRYHAAGSARDSATHAIKEGERRSLCGEDNVRPTTDDFNPSSTYACRRCIVRFYDLALGITAPEPSGRDGLPH